MSSLTQITKNPPKATLKLQGDGDGNMIGSLDEAREIKESLIELDEDDEVDVIVITGTESGFCGGLSPRVMIRLQKRHTTSEMREKLQISPDIVKTASNIGTPTIAKVDGDVYGAGLGFALMCDLAVASEDVIVQMNFADYDTVIDTGLSYMLPHLIGVHRTKELVYTGDEFKSQEVHEWGMFNRVVPDNEIDEVIDKYVEQIAEKESGAIKINKSVINTGLVADDLVTQVDEEMWKQTLAFEMDE